MDRKRIDTEEASADTFVSALLIITGVVAAGVLINAVYPIIWNMAGTATATAHSTDLRMRTDIRIVTTYARDDGYMKIILKNVGSVPIGIEDLKESTIVAGSRTNFIPLTRITPVAPNTCIDVLSSDKWCYTPYKTADSETNYWSPGEAVMIEAGSSHITPSSSGAYFQIVLPNGVYQTVEFAKSAS